MSTEKFLSDLRRSLQNHAISQTEVSRRSHVSQGTISKIVSGKKSILLSTAIKLWPVIYGQAFPFPETTTPTGTTDVEERQYTAPEVRHAE